jgi:hypothetical protein
MQETIESKGWEGGTIFDHEGSNETQRREDAKKTWGIAKAFLPRITRMIADGMWWSGPFDKPVRQTHRLAQGLELVETAQGPEHCRGTQGPEPVRDLAPRRSSALRSTRSTQGSVFPRARPAFARRSQSLYFRLEQ